MYGYYYLHAKPKLTVQQLYHRFTSNYVEYNGKYGMQK